MEYGASNDDGRGEDFGHLRIVQLRESERGLAQLAVLLLRMRQPLHQTFLMDELDATTAFARVEQRFLLCCLASAYPARIRFVCIVSSALVFIVECWIIHDVGIVCETYAPRPVGGRHHRRLKGVVNEGSCGGRRIVGARVDGAYSRIRFIEALSTCLSGALVAGLIQKAVRESRQ